MLIPSMTFYEMYEELIADRAKLEYKRQQLTPKAIKSLRKANSFPAWEWFEYTIPSRHNSYILFFYAANRQAAENPIFDNFSIVNVDSRRFVLKWGCSPYKHTESDTMVWTRRIDAYSTHFFTRYRERKLNNTEISINETACRYFTRNEIAFPIELNEDIKRNYQKYGEAAQRAMKVHDGLCFVRSGVEIHTDPETKKEIADALGFVYVTFVDDNTLTPSQNEATFKEGLRYSQKLFKDLITDIKE